jgi:hypothetical protein
MGKTRRALAAAVLGCALMSGGTLAFGPAAEAGAAGSRAPAVAAIRCTIVAPGPGWQLWRRFTGSNACAKCREAGRYWADRLGRYPYCHGVGSRFNLYLNLP